MRKITLLISLCAFVFMGQAQRSLVKSSNVYDFNVEAPSKGIVVDTLFPQSFIIGSPTLYTVEGGGFLAGTNKFGDMAKAQLFGADDTTYIVEGIMIWVGENTLGENAGDLTFSVNAVDDGIGTAFTSVAIPFAQVTPTSASANGDFFYSVMFDAPATVTDSFAVAVSWELGLVDGFGMVSTSDGDAMGANLCMEQWGDGTWNYVASGWNVDVDFAIFPLVSYPEVIAVEEATNVNLNNVKVYPNPFNDYVAFENLNKVSSVVFTNVLGQNVMTLSGMENKVEVSTSNLENGIYVISIIDNNGNVRTEKLLKK